MTRKTENINCNDRKGGIRGLANDGCCGWRKGNGGGGRLKEKMRVPWEEANKGGGHKDRTGYKAVPPVVGGKEIGGER